MLEWSFTRQTKRIAWRSAFANAAQFDYKSLATKLLTSFGSNELSALGVFITEFRQTAHSHCESTATVLPMNGIRRRSQRPQHAHTQAHTHTSHIPYTICAAHIPICACDESRVQPHIFTSSTMTALSMNGTLCVYALTTDMCVCVCALLLCCQCYAIRFTVDFCERSLRHSTYRRLFWLSDEIPILIHFVPRTFFICSVQIVVHFDRNIVSIIVSRASNGPATNVI